MSPNEIPSFEAILATPVTEAEARQFMADNQFKRDQEWARKNKQNPMELFGNCK